MGFGIEARRRVVRLLLAGGAVLLGAAPGTAQPPDGHLDKYVALMDGYCSGHRERALREVSGWGSSWIDWGVDELMDEARAAKGEEAVRWVGQAQVAFVLHAETALHGPETRLLFQDHEAHVGAARRLLEWFGTRKDRPPASRMLRPRDFLLPLVTAELLAGRPDEAALLAEKSLESYNRDVRMQLLAGCAEDMRAMVVRQTRDGQWPDRFLQRAEGRFRMVLDIDPENDSGRLRLGWVLVRRGRYAEAQELLEAVVRGPADDDRRFLALLFLGAAHEGAGQTSRAITTYRRATRLIPDGQVAHIALAQVLEDVGGQGAAREVLEPFFADRSRAWVRSDPWDEYAFGPPELQFGPLEDLVTRLCR